MEAADQQTTIAAVLLLLALARSACLSSGASEAPTSQLGIGTGIGTARLETSGLVLAAAVEVVRRARRCSVPPTQCGHTVRKTQSFVVCWPKKTVVMGGKK